MRVFDAHMNYMGRVTKKWELTQAIVNVFDADENPIYIIKGKKIPGWHTLRIFKTPELHSQRLPEAEGIIVKKWGGIVKEILTDADTWDLQVLPLVDGKLIRSFQLRLISKNECY
jgi:hypothetical protein